MTLVDSILLRLGAYKNRVKLNYLLTTGRKVTYYCRLLDENTLELPKLRKSEKDSKLPKTIKITTKPCFDETNKIHEYDAIEGIAGTVNWFGKTASTEDKEDRRIITAAIEAGERIAKANMTPNLFDVFKNVANWFPILILGLQLLTLVGLYVIMNP